MLTGLHKYWNKAIEQYIKPAGLRTGLIASFKLIATAFNAADDTGDARICSRPANRVLTVPVDDIKKHTHVAGSAVSAGNTIIAGASIDGYAYSMPVVYKGITCFSPSVVSTNVLLRGCDFIETDGLYLFKKHPGVAGVRSPSIVGDVYRFHTVGGALVVQDSGHIHSAKQPISVFAQTCINTAVAVYRRVLGTASAILSATTGTVAALQQDKTQCVWKENDCNYLCTETGCLYKAPIKSTLIIGADTDIETGTLLYNGTPNVLIIATHNGYDVVVDDIVQEADYPDTAVIYGDYFVGGVCTKSILINAMKERGTMLLTANEYKDVATIRALDKHIVKTDNVHIVQTLFV